MATLAERYGVAERQPEGRALTLAERYGATSQPTLAERYGQQPLVREPANDPNQKPWGVLDSLAAGFAGAAQGITGEAIPVVKDFVTSPVERSGREVGRFQSLGRMGADVAGTALASRFGGKYGAAGYAGLSTLGRNAEQRRLEIEREADQQAMQDGTFTALPQAVPGATAQSWADTDLGDVAEAGVNAALTAFAFKFGEGSDRNMLAAVAQGAKPLAAAGANVLRQAGFDAATALPSAVVARANAENMTAADWTDPKKLARVFEPKALLAEAATQAAFSAGAQAPGAVRAASGIRQAEMDHRINEWESQAEPDTGAPGFRPEDIARTRDAVEAERMEAQRVQAEQAAREAERSALSESQTRADAALRERMEEVQAQRDIDRIRQSGREAQETVGRLRPRLDPEVEALVGPLRERIAEGRLHRPTRPLQEGYTTREITPGPEHESPARLASRAAIDHQQALRESRESARRIRDEVLRRELEQRGLGPRETPLLPAPEGYSQSAITAGEQPGVMVGGRMFPGHTLGDDVDIAPSNRIDPNAPRPPGEEGGDPRGLQQREEQGQAPGGLRAQRLRDAVQSRLAATQSTAGEDVIQVSGGAGRGRPAPSPRLRDAVGRPDIDMDAQPRGDALGPRGAETPIPDAPDAIRERGAELRSEETGALPRRVHGINLQRFAGKDNAPLQDLIAGAAMTNADRIDAQRLLTKGVIERASKIDKWKDERAVRKLKPNEVLNDEEGIALDNYTLGRVAEFEANPTAENLKTMVEYLKASAGVGSAAGRALGARNVFRKAVYKELTNFQRAMVNMRDMFQAAKKDIPASALERLTKVEDKNDPMQLMQALMDIKQQDMTLWDKISSYRYLNMLSSPKTHELNITSNAVWFANHVALAPVRRRVDRVLGGERVYEDGETRAALAAARAGLEDALNKSIFVLKNGFRQSDLSNLDPSSLYGQLGGGNKNPLNYVSRALFAGDEFFKSISDAYYRTGMAYRNLSKKARENGLEGKDRDAYIEKHLESEMWGNQEIDEGAMNFAKSMVHQEPAFMQNLRTNKNLPPEVRAIVDQMLSIITPFYNIGTNLAKKSFVVAGGGYAAPFVKSLPKERRIELFAQSMAGTMTALAAFVHALNDGVTAAAPKDAAEREKFYQTGKQPHHIYFGDFGLDYRRLGPLAMPVMMAANAADEWKRTGSLSETAIGAIGESIRGFAELPILTGLGSLAEAISDPQAFFKPFLANVSSQFVPLSSMQRFINSTGLFNDKIPDHDRSVTQRVLSGTLASRAFPNRLSSYGQEITRGGMLTRRDPDPVYQELERLGIRPPSMPTRISIRGESTPLEGEERREILRARIPAYERVLKYIRSDAYQKMPDDRKRTALENMQKTAVSASGERGTAAVRRKRLRDGRD